ncbi:hypothetical protein HYV81_00720 [Candidatus Woesearchaeota archaeon]|nr:hypothetical protein [Candidatus Woesearchaeota archaeon]
MLKSGRSGKSKKGFIFSLEMAIAVFIVSSILLFASFYATKQTEDPYLRLQAFRTAEDIVAVLDYNNILTTFNAQSIQDQLTQLLPPNYDMKLTINGTFSENGGYLETNQSLPTGTFIASGSRIIVSSDGNQFGVVTYYVWLK